MLVQASDVGESVLDLHIDLMHALFVLFVAIIQLFDHHVHAVCRSSSCFRIATTSANRLHQLHPINLVLELVLHVRDLLLNLLDLLVHSISGSLLGLLFSF